MKADLKFPVNIFPPLLKRIISETNSAYSFPVSYIGFFADLINCNRKFLLPQSEQDKSLTWHHLSTSGG